MPTFVFWNAAGRASKEMIAELATKTSADVLILAESPMPGPDLLNSLNVISPGFYLPRSLCKSLVVLTRFHPRYLKPKFEGARFSIRSLRLPAREEILLVVAHLPSRLYFSRESLSFECDCLSDAIAATEESVGHKRTLLVGDLNLNPFEDGLTSARALNAVMTINIARRGNRTVQGRRYPFFYNPMWRFFGDREESSVAGTYYYERAEHITHFWNIYDQVLLRPDLLAGFEHQGLRVITSVGKQSLLTPEGYPDQRFSDHLPVVFRLNF